MLKLRSAAGIALAAIAASVLVAAPSFAAPVVASLTCSAPSGSNHDVTLDLSVSGVAADVTTPVQVTIMVASTPVLTKGFDAPPQWHYVASNAIPVGYSGAPVSVSVTVGSQVTTCSATWSAFAVSAWSLPKGLAAGKTGTVRATVDSSFELSDSYAVLQYESGGTWKDVGSSEFNGSGTAEFTMSAKRWKSVRVLVVPEEEPSYAYSWASPAQIFDVMVAKPTLASKPTAVIQSYKGTVVVNYGTYATAGTATLQRKTSTGAWTSVKKVTLTHGTATLAWAPTATYTYRVALKAAGGTTKYSPTFAVKYVPLLAVAAPASATKNATVTFTLTQHLAPPYYAKLQRWNGSTWVTVKTFVVGNTVQKVKAKVTATSKWRVSAAGYTSKAITVTVK